MTGSVQVEWEHRSSSNNNNRRWEKTMTESSRYASKWNRTQCDDISQWNSIQTRFSTFTHSNCWKSLYFRYNPAQWHRMYGIHVVCVSLIRGWWLMGKTSLIFIISRTLTDNWMCASACASVSIRFIVFFPFCGQSSTKTSLFLLPRFLLNIIIKCSNSLFGIKTKIDALCILSELRVKSKTRSDS